MGAAAFSLNLPSEHRADVGRASAGWVVVHDTGLMPPFRRAILCPEAPLAEEAGILGVLLHFKYNQSSKLPRRSTKRVQTIKKD
jgi:hypothetical protein